MKFFDTAKLLLEVGRDIRPSADDTIEGGMRILHDNVVPFLSKDRSYEEHFTTVATLFKSSMCYVLRITGRKYDDILKDAYELYLRKNHDYGDAWAEELDVLGMEAMRMRMWEKNRRAYTILDDLSGQQVSDESALDTIVDICNYCVMTGMWLVDHEY